MIRLLIGLGAELNAKDDDGKSPLHKAVISIEIQVRVLLEKGADKNATDNEGATPLWRAAYNGMLEAVAVLLEWEPNLDIQKDSTGWTALHAAYDHAEITRLLLNANADPTLLSTEGDPPMYLAADH